MALKLVLLSVDGSIAHAGAMDNTIAADLAALTRDLHAQGVTTALWSNKAWTVNKTTRIQDHFSALAGVPVALHGAQSDGSPARRMGNSAAPIMARYGAQGHETVLVGGKEEDMLAGVNNRLLLIRPDWYAQHMDYGFPVASVNELKRFLFVFALRQHPIFWQIVSGNLHASAAGPFSTMREDYAEFGASARSAAKQGLGRVDFWFYLAVASMYFGGLLTDAQCICSYPGHDPAHRSAIRKQSDQILTRLGKCFRKPYFHDLIVRHTAAPKMQPVPSGMRTYLPQINSVHLNPYPHQYMSEEPRKSRLNLNGKRVLVVDDFCTSGRSLEVARAYLENAGATAKSYSWLKTINTAYEAISPPIKLDPYRPNTLTAEPTSVAHSYHSGIVAPAAPDEIRRIYRAFVTWK